MSPFSLEAIGEPLTEISVVDGHFETVASGVEHLRVALPPGLFQVEFRVGGETVTENVEVGGSGVVVVRQKGPARVRSAAPLEKATSALTYQGEAARKLSRAGREVQGMGQVLLFVRDPDGTEGRGLTDTPLSLLRLRSQHGALHLFDEAQSDPRKGWAGVKLAVKPGAYRLQYLLQTGKAVESMLYVFPNWQTQVYLLAPEGVLPADALSRATVLMTRRGGFDGRDESLARTERARAALDAGATAMGEAAVRELLKAKFQNPMLGLFGAHLLLRAEHRHEWAQEIIDNLAGLMPGSPDVLALALAFSDRGWAKHEWVRERRTVQEPPLLRASWQCLVEATSTRPWLIERGSLADDVADLLVGNGGVLSWRYVGQGAEAVKRMLQNQRPSTGTLKMVASFASSVDDWPKLRDFQRTHGLSLLAQAVLWHLALAPESDDQAQLSALVRATGHPALALRRAIDEIARVIPVSSSHGGEGMSPA